MEKAAARADMSTVASPAVSGYTHPDELDFDGHHHRLHGYATESMKSLVTIICLTALSVFTTLSNLQQH